MSTALPTIAFFGATGDVAGFCLSLALKAGHQCVALARAPGKLTASLQQKDVSAADLANLRIVQGDARDKSAVLDALKVNGQVVDIIVSSLGSLPDFRWSLTSPMVIRDPTICEDGARVLVEALESLNPVKKPLLLAVTTTGIPPVDKPRDVPLVYVPLYHWLLHSPHQDKAKMEALIRNTGADSSDNAVFSKFILIKATLLMDGPSRGTQNVRFGTEDKPALGYTIRRAEVAEWMYKHLISVRPDSTFLNTAVTLTA